MTKSQLLTEVLKLPPEDRQLLINEAIDSLPGEFAIDPSMTPELREELDRRYRDLLEHPDRGSSWEEVSVRIKARLSKTNKK
jgi:putative addiction module component (TIGR02574 family)